MDTQQLPVRKLFRWFFLENLPIAMGLRAAAVSAQSLHLNVKLCAAAEEFVDFPCKS
jgi:hypothetical protein